MELLAPFGSQHDEAIDLRIHKYFLVALLLHLLGVHIELQSKSRLHGIAPL